MRFVGDVVSGTVKNTQQYHSTRLPIWGMNQPESTNSNKLLPGLFFIPDFKMNRLIIYLTEDSH